MEIYNSLTKKKDNLIPINPKRVSVYVCGITPYDTTHLGHAFTYISFDTLIRYLKFAGFGVNYTQNITDINDRDKDILQRTREQKITWTELSNFWTEIFIKDMNALNWTIPNHFIKASENIAEAITMIQKLLNNKVAYQINGSVYLDVLKFPNFGKLSGFNRNKMLQLAKDFEEDIDNPEKKNPLDFTLWRTSEPNQEKHIPIFQSPFGPGRPGWHIECSSMAVSTLGQQIDIHGGGNDLIFPHHESEIIQSESATKKSPFAKIWMHTGTVYFKGEKMSKSKANLVKVSDLLKKYSGNSIRWLILSNHWRKNWEFKEEDLITSQNKIMEVQDKLKRQDYNFIDDPEVLERFTKIMNQDLNTPKGLEMLFKKPNKKIYEVLGFN